jgi:hypothetical protein
MDAVLDVSRAHSATARRARRAHARVRGARWHAQARVLQAGGAECHDGPLRRLSRRRRRRRVRWSVGVLPPPRASRGRSCSRGRTRASGTGCPRGIRRAHRALRAVGPAAGTRRTTSRIFERYYAQIVAEGPADADLLRAWIGEEFGEFDLTTRWPSLPNGEAASCATRRATRLRTVSCASAIRQPWDKIGAQARRVVAALGSIVSTPACWAPIRRRSFDTGEPITSLHAGPARLAALMTMGDAKELGQPRSAEWIAAAREGLPAVPPTTFSPNLREAARLTARRAPKALKSSASRPSSRRQPRQPRSYREPKRRD